MNELDSCKHMDIALEVVPLANLTNKVSTHHHPSPNHQGYRYTDYIGI
jgi:hypothetical protein